MQNVLINYAREILDVQRDTHGSIADALERLLPLYTEAQIQKMREAAADLERILVLELGRRAEPVVEDYDGTEDYEARARRDEAQQRRADRDEDLALDAEMERAGDVPDTE